MTRSSGLQAAVLLALALFAVSIAHADDRAGDADGAGVPEPVAKGYDALSAAIRAEDMERFMALFHRDYLFEGLDGAGTDRGPWRRLWLERFELVDYDRVAFSPELRSDTTPDGATIRAREIAVWREDDGSRHLEESFLDDEWVREGGEWSLIARRVSAIGARGVLASSGAIASPRLLALEQELALGKASAEVAFWAEVEGSGAPLVEVIDGDAEQVSVTFLWRARGGESRVTLDGGLPLDAASKRLARIGESGVWHRTERLPRDARLTYAFEVEARIHSPASGDQEDAVFLVGYSSVDPLNPKTSDERSLVVLPGAGAGAKDRARQVEGRPKGELDRMTIRSSVLDERRFVSVYVPADYDEDGAPYRSAFLMDQGSYATRQATRIVLDNLIAEGEIPPLVVFLVHGEGSSSPDLEASSTFVEFLGEELIAWARENFHLSAKREDIVIGGSGLGAALAAACASIHPETFQSVLAESGDFSACLDATSAVDRGCIVQRFSAIPKQDLRFYIVACELEAGGLPASSQHLRDVLAARGYDATYLRVQANHAPATWFDAMARGLRAFFATK